MTAKVIEVQPTEALCWVCGKTMPMEKLQYLGDNTYRCKAHRGSTILKAGQKHEQEKTRRMVIKGSCTFEIEIEEVRT